MPNPKNWKPPSLPTPCGKVTPPFKIDLLPVSTPYLPSWQDSVAWLMLAQSSCSHVFSQHCRWLLQLHAALRAGERFPQASSHCAHQFSCYRLSWPWKSCETLFIAHLPNSHTILHSQLVCAYALRTICQDPKCRGTRTHCPPIPQRLLTLP